MMNDFLSLQYALYSMGFVCVLGGGFFLFTSIHVVHDKKKADLFIRKCIHTRLHCILCSGDNYVHETGL